MKEIKGDLLKLAKDYDIIIHGCNCFNTMGAGIAKQIKEKYPIAYEVDLETKYGDQDKLGTYTEAYDEKDDVIIINAYTQYYLGSNFNYEAFKKIMSMINHNFIGKHIAIPQIGAGIGGGDWSLIKDILNNVMKDVKLTVVYYDRRN